MATSKEYIEYLTEQLSDLDEIVFRPMMGEYLVYYRGKLAGDVCDERLLIKPVAAAKKLMPDAIMEPPYKGAKDMILIEDVDDKRFLTELFEAIYDDLPAPKRKK